MLRAQDGTLHTSHQPGARVAPYPNQWADIPEHCRSLEDFGISFPGGAKECDSLPVPHSAGVPLKQTALSLGTSPTAVPMLPGWGEGPGVHRGRGDRLRRHLQARPETVRGRLSRDRVATIWTGIGQCGTGEDKQQPEAGLTVWWEPSATSLELRAKMAPLAPT